MRRRRKRAHGTCLRGEFDDLVYVNFLFIRLCLFVDKKKRKRSNLFSGPPKSRKIKRVQVNNANIEEIVQSWHHESDESSADGDDYIQAFSLPRQII